VTDQGCPVIACECDDLSRFNGSATMKGGSACYTPLEVCGIVCGRYKPTVQRCATAAEWNDGQPAPGYRKSGEACNPLGITSSFCDVSNLPMSYDCGNGRMATRQNNVLCPMDTNVCPDEATLKAQLCK
jgi:hypothetical protein